MGKPLIKTPALLGRDEPNKQGSASRSCLFPLGSQTIRRCERPLGWISYTRRRHSIDTARLWQSAICSPNLSSPAVCHKANTFHPLREIDNYPQTLYSRSGYKPCTILLTLPPTHLSVATPGSLPENTPNYNIQIITAHLALTMVYISPPMGQNMPPQPDSTGYIEYLEIIEFSNG